jgi:hypothetical protein
MRKPTLILIAVGLAVPAAWGGWLYFSLCDQDRVMRAKFSEIRVGMTLAEVESVMGRPFNGHGGDYSWPVPGSRTSVKGWDGPGSLTIDVGVDDTQVVLAKRIHPTRPTSWDITLALARAWRDRLWP